jgi:acetyl esterase/lipase
MKCSSSVTRSAYCTVFRHVLGTFDVREDGMHDGKRWARIWTVALLMVGLSAGANAAERPAHGVPVPLWPGGAPLAVGMTPQDIPALTPYYPANPAGTGTAVVVCPGGSYRHLAMDHEGRQVAEWFNKHGIPAFVLTYRLGPRYRHPAMLLDAQRAIRYVRMLAPELSLRPDRIGIMGFSAGGHLASTAGTHFDEGQSDAEAPIDRLSARPDFLILGYPVISFTESYTHKGSREHLLGLSPDPALVESLSNERRVSSRTPPTFLFHTDDDSTVPPENSVAFYLALKRAGVPAELHVYQHGTHGIGLAPADAVLSTWPDRLADWLRVRGLLRRRMPQG